MRGHPKLIGYQEEPHPWNEWVRTTTGRLSDKQLLRELIPVTPLGSTVQVSLRHVVGIGIVGPACLIIIDLQTGWPSEANGENAVRPVKSFGLNDYLGLAVHPHVRQAVATAALQQGTGGHLAGQQCSLQGCLSQNRSLEFDTIFVAGKPL